MHRTPLTLRSIVARPVVLKLKRPVVARIATITEWPLILIDLVTEDGVVGRSYLEPYVVKSMVSTRPRPPCAAARIPDDMTRIGQSWR